jgi:acetyltransferase-like isoleucine patch superfamily enzyme
MYQNISKFISVLRCIKLHLNSLIYYLIPHLWFRKLGKGCAFVSLIRFSYTFRDIQVGERCVFGTGVFLNCGHDSYIKIGNFVSMNDYMYVSSLYGIELGDNTQVGEFVSIRDNDHDFSNPDIPIRTQGFRGDKIIIGRDVWIGRGVYIGKGVTIGEGAVIGANSVVVKSIPAFAIAVGSPAKVIRYRVNPDLSIQEYTKS